MKILKILKLAILGATLLLHSSTTRADNQGKADEKNHGAATINFTKWITVLSPRAGIFADMVGEITGGDAGDGTYTGEALTRVVDPVTGVITVEALYHIHGSKHSFTARIRAVQEVAGVGQKGTITGVVTDGWLEGHTVQGEYIVEQACYPPGTGIGNCFDVTLNVVKRHSNDDDNASDHRDAIITVTKHITAFLPPGGEIFATIAGTAGGDLGTGTVIGDAFNPLDVLPDGSVTFEAEYRIVGSKHSLTIHFRSIQAPDKSGVLIGVVKDGWLKGNTVEGHYTARSCDEGVSLTCFDVTFIIKKGSKAQN